MNRRTILFFERKIFQQYGESEQFEKCRKYLLNVLESMTERVEWFNSLSNDKKFDICETSALIAMQSERESIQLASLKSKPLTEYGINRDNPKFDLKEIISKEEKIKLLPPNE